MSRRRSSTVRLTGAAANDFMASAAAFYCTSEEEAQRLASNATGAYGASLQRALRAQGWLKSSEQKEGSQ